MLKDQQPFKLILWFLRFYGLEPGKISKVHRILTHVALALQLVCVALAACTFVLDRDVEKRIFTGYVFFVNITTIGGAINAARQMKKIYDLLSFDAAIAEGEEIVKVNKKSYVLLRVLIATGSFSMLSMFLRPLKTGKLFYAPDAWVTPTTFYVFYFLQCFASCYYALLLATMQNLAICSLIMLNGYANHFREQLRQLKGTNDWVRGNAKDNLVKCVKVHWDLKR